MEQFGALIDDVLDLGAKVIVVPGLAAALAVREQIPETPVVAVGLPSTVIYPDLFASLSRPGAASPVSPTSARTSRSSGLSC